MKVSEMANQAQDSPDLHIVSSELDYAVARELIEEYAQSLDFSLEFQNIDEELSHLQLYYGPPTGMLILVKADDKFVGCTCVRNLGDFVAEIKRMYVKPTYRGRGLGRKMLDRAIDGAKRMGYRFIRLDTVPDMESAIQLYLSAGFYEIEDYRYNPIAGARFMEYKL